MIELINVTKSFKKGKVEAVKKVSFSVNKGEILGLLGANGAGKTTTMRMMSTLLTPTSGDILFEGRKISANAKEYKRHIGFLTNEIRLDKQFSANESAEYYGRLYGMSKEEIAVNKEKWFSYFGIEEYADRQYGTLSTGMKQKVSIAICLIHDPDIIIFDEPTNGLDVPTQKSIEQYILDAKNIYGKTVVISTHLMDVIERLAERTVVLVDGRVAFVGTVEEMKHQEEKKTLSDAFVSLYEKYSDDEKACC